MRRLFFVSIIMFSVIFTSIATANGVYPDWILPELRRYPIETYLFDIGMSKGVGEDAYRDATSKAGSKVAEKIVRKVAYIIWKKRGELNYDLVREYYSPVMEDYCSGRYTFPALKVEGLKARNLSVDNVRNDNKTFALVYIKRNELKRIYENHVSELKREIKSRLDLAEAAERALNINSAISNYLRTYPLYEALKEARIVQIGAEYKSDYDAAYRKLVAAATKTVGDPLPHRKVIKRVEELRDESIIDHKDICRAVDFQIRQQVSTFSGNTSAHPLIYEDSEMISPFAIKFSNTLQQEFEWAIVDFAIASEQTPIRIGNINEHYPYRITPSIWKNGDEITIRTALRNVNTGKFLASSVVRFMKNNLRVPLIFIPRGIDQAKKEKEAFNPRYLVTETSRGKDETLVEHAFSPVGGLKVDVRTGEGNSNLSYTEGDTVKIFARVNQPAHIRLLYTLADQRRTLLVNNFHIDKDNVNNYVEIGTFRCAPPFGVEFLNVLAQTERFNEIETHEEDGYFFLVEQNPEKASSQYRGLQRISKEKNEKMLIGPKPILEEQPDFQQVGAQLVFTVEEKKD